MHILNINLTYFLLSSFSLFLLLFFYFIVHSFFCNQMVAMKNQKIYELECYKRNILLRCFRCLLTLTCQTNFHQIVFLWISSSFDSLYFFLPYQLGWNKLTAFQICITHTFSIYWARVRKKRFICPRGGDDGSNDDDDDDEWKELKFDWSSLMPFHWNHYEGAQSKKKKKKKKKEKIRFTAFLVLNIRKIFFIFFYYSLNKNVIIILKSSFIGMKEKGRESEWEGKKYFYGKITLLTKKCSIITSS